MKSKKSKPIRLKGVCMVANKPSQNGRIFTQKAIQLLVSKYNRTSIKPGLAQGMFGHSKGEANPNQSEELKLISHRIVSLKVEGDRAVAVVELLPTPSGNQIKEGLANGVKFGLSIQAFGTTINVGRFRDMTKTWKLWNQRATWDKQSLRIAKDKRVANDAEILSYGADLHSIDIVLTPACRESVLKVLK